MNNILLSRKDIDRAYVTERIQRRATKLIPELRVIMKNSLNECGLINLQTRRSREDQIDVFSILNGYENVDRSIFFT